jgi:hypothetical protein
MNNQIKFYPFHAINEFMRPDFRLTIIRDVLSNTAELPSNQASALTNITKKAIKVPGFRSSEKAPAIIKVMPTAKSFEKNPELVKVILSAWVTIHNELATQVFTVLRMRNWLIVDKEEGESYFSLASEIVDKWPVLPLNVERSLAPGFLPKWPKGEDFETLYNTYMELYPGSDSSIDQVSLMAVWLTLRLPYEIEVIPT